jgi:hypothetical protein
MAFPRPTKTYDNVPELNFKGVYIAGKPANSRWDVCCRKGLIKEMEQSVESGDAWDGFMAPSLCHVSHRELRSSTPHADNISLTSTWTSVFSFPTPSMQI